MNTPTAHPDQHPADGTPASTTPSAASADAPPQPGFVVDRELFPWQPRYQRLSNGAHIHYVDEGEGPVLLLLHGNPTWSFLYRHIIVGLRGEFRLIAPDYPGFGLSTAPAGYGFTPAEHAACMSELVHRLGLQDVTIMVQDWGGPIGFALAAEQPERVSGFIIGNSWAWPLERPGQKLFSLLMGGWPGRLAAGCCNGVVRFFMSKGVARGLAADELAMYLAPFAQRRSRRATHVFPAQLRRAMAFLQRVRSGLDVLTDRPVLIVWGQQDFAFQQPERRRFEQLFPNHRTVLLDKAAHFIQEDAPDAIIAAVRVWFVQRSDEAGSTAD